MKLTRAFFRPLSFALVLAAGCAEALAPETADLSGEVIVVPTESAPNRIVLRGAFHNVASDGLSEIVVHIDGPVFATDEDGRSRGSNASAIQEGSRLYVWTTGALLKSLPPQVYARQVLIQRTGTRTIH